MTRGRMFEYLEKMRGTKRKVRSGYDLARQERNGTSFYERIDRHVPIKRQPADKFRGMVRPRLGGKGG